MQDLTEIRRANIRALVAEMGGYPATVSKMGYGSASLLSQIAGPNPTRSPTEKAVRKMEAAMGLPHGYLDRAPQPGEKVAASVKAPEPAAPSAPATPFNKETVTDVIRLVGSIADDESVVLPTGRFADVVALAFSDAVDHGGTPREGHIRQVVRLLK